MSAKQGPMARALAAAQREKLAARGGPERDVPRFPLIPEDQRWPAVTLGGPGNTGAGTGLALLPPVDATGAAQPPAADAAAQPPAATGAAQPPATTGAAQPPAADAGAAQPPAATGAAQPPAADAAAQPPAATGAAQPPAAQPPADQPPAAAQAQPLPMAGEVTRFVRFGQELFVLDSTVPTAHLGAPNVLTKQDFDQRFSTDPALQDVVSKYWRVDNVLSMPISEKQPNQFRVPCDEADKTKMKQVFALYLTATQDRVASYGATESDEKRSYQMLAEHIQAYINELNANPPHLPCVTKEEITRPIQVPTGAAATAGAAPIDAYYTLLPKIFFLLYQNQKAQNPLDVSKIFASYPPLNQTVRSYLDSLEAAGPFESERGLYDMANAVIELFFLLRKLFPNLYGNLIPTPEVYQRWAVLGFPLPPGGQPAAVAPAGQPAPAAGEQPAAPGGQPAPAAAGEQPAAGEGAAEALTDEQIDAMLDPILNRIAGLPDATKDAIKAAIHTTFTESRAKHEPQMLTGLQGVLTALADFIAERVQAYETMLESTKNMLNAYSAVNALRIAALTASPIGSLQFGDGEANHDARVALNTALEAVRASYPEGDPRRIAFDQFIAGQTQLDAAIQALQGRTLQQAAAAAAGEGGEVPGGQGGEGPAAGEGGPGGAAAGQPGGQPTGDVAALTAERDAARAELAAARAALAALQAGVDTLRQTLAGLQGQGAAAAGEAAQAQTELEQRVAALAAATEAVQRLSARVSELEAELTRLRAAGQASATRVAELTAELAAATSAVNHLQTQVAELGAQLEALRGAGGAGVAGLAALQEQLAAARAAEAAAAGRATTLQRQLDAATQALTDLQATSQTAQAELRRLLAEAQAAVTRVTGEKNAAEARATAAEAEVAQLTQQIAALQAELEAARRTGGDVTRLTAEIERLTQALQAAQAEVARLRGQLGTAQQQAAAAAQKAAEDLAAAKREAEAGLAKCAADAAAEKAALEAQTAAEMAALREQIAAGDAGRAAALAAAQKQAADAAAAAEAARRAAEAAVAAAKAETREAQGQRDTEAAAKAAAQAQTQREIENRKALYRNISTTIQGLMQKVGAKTGKLTTMPGQSGQLQAKLLTPLTTEYSDAIPVAQVGNQQNIVAFSAAMNELESYLGALDGQYNSWKYIFEGGRPPVGVPGSPGAPVPGSPGFMVAKGPAIGPLMRIRISILPNFDREYDINEVKPSDPSFPRTSVQQLVQAIGAELDNTGPTQLKDLLLKGVDRQTLENFIAMLTGSGVTIRRGGFGVKIPDLPGGPGANAYGIRQPGGIVQPPPSPARVEAPPSGTKVPAYDPEAERRKREADEAERRRRLEEAERRQREADEAERRRRADEEYRARLRAAEEDLRRRQEAAAANAYRRQQEAAAAQAAADAYRRQQEAAAAAAAQRSAGPGRGAAAPAAARSGTCAQYKHNAKACNADPRCVYHNYNCVSKRSLGMAGGGIIAPTEVPGILKQQDAWNHLNDAYVDLPAEIQEKLPAPPAAPIYEVAEPFNTYINKESNPILLEEAREALGLLPPKDIDTYMEEPNAITPALLDVIMKYKAAMPSVAPEWLTSMVQADILKQTE